MANKAPNILQLGSNADFIGYFFIEFKGTYWADKADFTNRGSYARQRVCLLYPGSYGFTQKDFVRFKDIVIINEKEAADAARNALGMPAWTIAKSHKVRKLVHKY
jgi:hypothetical protein